MSSPPRRRAHPRSWLETALVAFAGASTGSVEALGELRGPVARWLWRQPVDVLRALDRRFRDRAVLARLGLPVADAWSVTFAEELPAEDALVAWVLGSVQRNGYAREAAVAGLGSGPMGRWTLAALINRTVDPVHVVAARARAVLAERMGAASIADLVEALPMLDAVRAAQRASGATVLDVLERVVQATPDALATGQHTGREGVRLACLRRRLRQVDPVPALRDGLVDPSPRVRRLARDGVIRSSRAVQDALTEAMAASPSPDIRLVALRQRRRAGDVHAVRAGCFDPNVDVRFYARRYLRALGGGDLRAMALEVLASPEEAAGNIVGALALLSDVGWSADASQIRPFVHHPRRRVAREATRTLSLLGEARQRSDD